MMQDVWVVYQPRIKKHFRRPKNYSGSVLVMHLCIMSRAIPYRLLRLTSKVFTADGGDVDAREDMVPLVS